MDFARFRSQNSSKHPNKTKLDSYSENDVLLDLRNKKFNILTWWKSNAAAYPILSSMAQDILIFSVSIILLESTFSIDGRVINQYWSSFSPSMAKILVYTKIGFMKNI